MGTSAMVEWEEYSRDPFVVGTQANKVGQAIADMGYDWGTYFLKHEGRGRQKKVWLGDKLPELRPSVFSYCSLRAHPPLNGCVP